VLVLSLAACSPARAGTPAVTLRAALTPERLGGGTTIKFALQLNSPAGEFPPALRTIDLRYPANLGIATSGLGIDHCSAQVLQEDGPPGCPANSVMGYGSGTVEVPFGAEILTEHTRATIFMAPLHEGHLGLLFFINGPSPVSAQLVLPAIVLPTGAPFGGDLTTTLPLIASVPDAPDVALTGLTVTLGPSGVTYYEFAHGRKIRYRPRGIKLPPRCPRGGFRFATELHFNDGSQASARAVVGCP
jgi:hypothetical protein